MKKTVLICSNIYPPNFLGGAEIIAHHHAKTLAKMGHDVIVFAGDLQGRLEAGRVQQDCYQGIPVYRVGLNDRGMDPSLQHFHDAVIERQFEQLIDQHGPDVVHLHNVPGLPLGMIRAARRRNIRVVLTVHDHWGFCLKNTLLMGDGAVCRDHTKCSECLPEFSAHFGRSFPIRLRRDYFEYCLRGIDAVISPSEYLARAYIEGGMPVGKFRIIPYGIDVDSLSRVAKQNRTAGVRFTFVGYVGRHKGVQLLLPALSQLSGHGKAILNIVGEGDLSESMKAETQARGLDPQVRFWGKLRNEEIGRVFEQTDVFILPSVWPENQPVTITEALASGTPVIASRIGGIPEMVRDGFNGFLFQPGSVNGLADAMKRFISDPGLIGRLAPNAAQSMQNNSFDRQLERILRVYDEPVPAAGALEPPRFDIICVGRTIGPASRAALDEMDRRPRHRTWRFLWAEWLTPAELGAGDAVWVVDPSLRPDDIESFELMRQPWVAPVESAPWFEPRLRPGGLLSFSGPREAANALSEVFAGDSQLALTEPGLRPITA